METNTYAARLRYLDAGDLTDPQVRFDGLGVYGADGEKVGTVDGFIIDPDRRRVHYLVIDSGGWFSSRRLLLPIGHAAFADDRTALRSDMTRDALRRMPEYDEDRFSRFSDEELRAFERNTVVACCPDEPLEDVSADAWSYDSRRHYTQPAWWSTSAYSQERLRPVRGASSTRTAETTGAAPLRERHDRELVTARGADEDRTGTRTGDPSPHLGGRAQPGDVLGIESGGETTAIGDTAEDEDERRRRAERDRR